VILSLIKSLFDIARAGIRTYFFGRLIGKAVKVTSWIFAESKTLEFFKITFFESIFNVFLIFVMIIQWDVNSAFL